MATRTLGTNANNSLTAILWSIGATSQADVATVAAGIFSDGNVNPGAGSGWSDSPFPSKAQNSALPWPGALENSGAEGRLLIPNRGVLKVLPGDFIAIDSATGWPILVSGAAINSGSTLWTHS